MPTEGPGLIKPGTVSEFWTVPDPSMKAAMSRAMF
jgi:hypothetical protein